MPITEATARWVDQEFEESIVPTLVRYIEIPNKSPAFDPDWREHGHVDRAVELLAGWARAHLPEGASLEVLRLAGWPCAADASRWSVRKPVIDSGDKLLRIETFAHRERADG